MITARKNIADELVTRLHSRHRPDIFVSHTQVRTIWGEVGSAFRHWCSQNDIKPQETENGYKLQHRPKAQ